LDVWNKAIEFVVKIYAITENFPKSETYGISNQIRRAAVSIPSNISCPVEFVFLFIQLGPAPLAVCNFFFY
jgi:hypothetical protein